MFILPGDKLAQIEVIYSITDRSGWLYYIGRCALHDVSRLPDAGWHSIVGKLISNPQFMEQASINTLDMVIAGTEQGLNRHWNFVTNMKPQNKPEPKPATRKGRKTRRVVHVETQEVYESASEVCRVFEIQQASLSRHLSGMLQSVGGHQFEYERSEE